MTVATSINQQSLVEPIRLDYLDSLRGLAALYVVLGHVLLDYDASALNTGMRLLAEWLNHGKFGVAFFIVLSGYCLMLPVARSGTHMLKGGFLSYIGRRARRIYPAYLAAMALSLLMITAVPPSLAERSFWLTTFTPAFGWSNLITHGLLVHNLSNDWLYKINAPFWSVATEWQIYFLFPLLLLPLTRRIGIVATVPCALAVSLLPIVVFRRFETAAPWFLSLFAIGMLAATFTHAPSQPAASLRARVALGPTAGVSAVLLLVVIAAMSARRQAWGWKYDLVTQMLAAPVFATGIAWLATSKSESSRCVRALLQRSPIVGLGACSYSLYLTHGISLPLTTIGLSTIFWHGSPSIRLAIGLAAGAVVSVVFASLFYFLFERPFLRHRPTARHTPKAVESTSPPSDFASSSLASQ